MAGGPYQLLPPAVTEQQLECVSANILCSRQNREGEGKGKIMLSSSCIPSSQGAKEDTFGLGHLGKTTVCGFYL